MLATFFGRRANELAPEDASALDAHLSGCASCQAAITTERAFDDRLSRAMIAVPVPDGLKSKILDGISAQRGSWWRQKAYVATGFATAACLLVGGVIAWNIISAPELTGAGVVAEHDRRLHSPEARINSFMTSHGMRFDPERRFDMSLFDEVSMGDLRGQQVPMLLFKNVRNNARAWVYVVKDSVLNWKKLPRDGSSVPGQFGLQMAVLQDAVRGDVGYVIIFSGESLELFLEARSSI